MNKNQRALREIMDKYDQYLHKWTVKHGSALGFDEWFTSQVVEFKPDIRAKGKG
jgi:succinate dehydrogenase flavin-adding protein (antitoxin of CptAB toxin-antitoxin module)